jgi:acyl-coenzyme A thioesterase PaaI-like protein
MDNLKFARLIRRINIYPPFLGMGIKMTSFSENFTRFDVELRARWYNRNLFGTHFGGSLYAMSDPFFVFIVTLNFGREYIVWDKSACIDFLRPARGVIRGRFEIAPSHLAQMRAEVDQHGKRTFEFETDLLDEDDVAVARVHKHVYVRRKERAKVAEAKES